MNYSEHISFVSVNRLSSTCSRILYLNRQKQRKKCIQNEQKHYFVSYQKKKKKRTKRIRRETFSWNAIKIYTTRHQNPRAYLKLNTSARIAGSYSIGKNKC